jgi:hypothetical protein
MGLEVELGDGLGVELGVGLEVGLGDGLGVELGVGLSRASSPELRQ